MKRASYREAIRWIAENDNAWFGDDAYTISGYVTSRLIADIFGVSLERVGEDVSRIRAKEEA